MRQTAMSYVVGLQYALLSCGLFFFLVSFESQLSYLQTNPTVVAEILGLV